LIQAKSLGQQLDKRSGESQAGSLAVPLGRLRLLEDRATKSIIAAKVEAIRAAAEAAAMTEAAATTEAAEAAENEADGFATAFKVAVERG
jgi:hypothetical protein